MTLQNGILPICIYHRINVYPDSNPTNPVKTYRGYIGFPDKIKLSNDKTTYKCNKYLSDKWKLAGTFYAIDPGFRPIPVGMKIFCAKQPMGYPYDTSDVYLMYDPFDIKEDCIYFITYIMKVPNTVPLYFHKMGEHIFPSFDLTPPTEDPRWSQTDISPIYVMTSDTVGDLFTDTCINNELKFKCINGRCIPWPRDIDNIYGDNPDAPLLPFDNCVVYCNEFVVSNNNRKPQNLLESIDNKIKNNKSDINYNIFIIVCICLMIIILVLLVFL